MNKYMGFYELKAINIPAIQWNKYTFDTVLDTKLLWTLRVAVETGVDINLPRIIGVSAETAKQEGRKLLEQYDEKGIVVYYPYFIAEKSGVMEIAPSRLVIEAVGEDLWNLVSYGHKNVTIIKTDAGCNIEGDPSFLSEQELLELERYAHALRGRFRNELAEGLSLFAEWSYAFNTDTGRHPIGRRFLVFYELRTV